MDEDSPLLLSSTSTRKKGVMSTSTSAPRNGLTDRYVVGVGLLLAVVILWTTSNFITAALETADSLNWSKPFLITYLNTSSFTLYLIPTAWRWYRGTTPSVKSSDQLYEPIPHSPTRRPRSLLNSESEGSHQRRSTSLTRSPIPSSPRAPVHSIDSPILPLTSIAPSAPHDPLLGREIEAQIPLQEDKLTIRETAIVAAWWSALWFIANWAVNASLAWTSVASVTILSCTSGFFTLALGRVFGVETLTQTKIFAVLASFFGVVLVTRSDSIVSTSTSDFDSSLPSHPILGDFTALLSASLYAVYVVFLKVRIGDESRADMQLMLGFAGLFNTIFLIPFFPILHFTGLETFGWPPSSTAWSIIIANMFITVSSDYLYVLAMLKTTPMLVTIGLSLTIPLALVVSLFIGHGSHGITWMSLLGAGMVVIGFGMLGWQWYEESRIDTSQPLMTPGNDVNDVDVDEPRDDPDG